MTWTDRPDRPDRMDQAPQEGRVVRVYTAGWGGPGGWGPDERERPGIPWIGVFLIVFGALLVVERTFPQYANLGDVLVLAAGLASLVVWAIRRGVVPIYAGAFLTALALPGTLQGLGYSVGPGWGTVFFGLALLFIAAIRYARRGGWGWQVTWGAILLLLGGSQVAAGNVADVILPLLLVVLGLLLITRRRP